MLDFLAVTVTLGRDFYQGPFEHRTKGRILISYAIILSLVVEHFQFPSWKNVIPYVTYIIVETVTIFEAYFISYHLLVCIS